METAEIRELTERAEWLAAYPVLRQLRDHLSEREYLDHLTDMREEGYRLFAAVEGDEIVAVAGVGVRTNFYNGRHLFVFDLVTRADRRSEGVGGRLMAFLEDLAREEGCESLTLESGLWRDDAHRFYEDDCGMDRYCYTFKKELD